MNTKLFLLCMLMGVVCTALIRRRLGMGFPPNYESKTAVEKLSFLMKEVANDKMKSGAGAGAITLARLVAPELIGGTSFTPTGHLYSDMFPENKGIKGIHFNGSAGSGKFVWNKYTTTTYTGGFQKADNVFVRFSTATAAAPGVENGPGISVKILRDKVSSGSFPVMWQLKGQQSTNFFANCMSNHIDSPPRSDLNLPQKILLAKFKRYDVNPGLVGLSDVARWNQDGTEVKSPKAPTALVWVPLEPVKQQCATSKMEGNIYSCLSKLKAGTALYDIYAVENPITPTQLSKLSSKKSALKKMGQFVLTSGGLVPSKFADEKVQFKHVFWADDIKALGMQKKWNVKEGDEYDVNGGCKKFFDGHIA